MFQNIRKLVIYSLLIKACFICFAKAAEPKIYCPKLEFKYNWQSRIIDCIGSLAFRNSVNTERQSKLAEVFPKLVLAWHRNGPVLFNQVYSFFKREFKAKKRTVIIYLSNSWSYGSDNLLILGLRHYIEPQLPLSVSLEDQFTDLVFHELLHVWVDNNISNSSAMLIKYSNEHVHVREHIHLMAIQKLVYLKLNRHDMLKMLDESYRKLSLPEYRRAWEIVNDIEGYEVIVQDIAKNLV